MQVVRAECAGACYGVQRALDMADEVIAQGRRAYTLGPLIHNPHVVADLAARGATPVDAVDDIAVVGDVPPAVIVRSHGVTPQVFAAVRSRGFEMVNATCPHVARAQKAAADLARSGCCVIVVGEAGHPEVEGLCAWTQAAGGKVDVVSGACDIPADIGDPVGVVVQTTQRREVLDNVVDALRESGMNPEVKNTICAATRQRQDAAAKLASQVDAMVVIGGRNSSNTTRLAEICADVCPRTLHIESAEELDISQFAGCESVGVTAGASTPEGQIHAVEQFLRDKCEACCGS